jgi:hypothetical protein
MTENYVAVQVLASTEIKYGDLMQWKHSELAIVEPLRDGLAAGVYSSDPFECRVGDVLPGYRGIFVQTNGFLGAYAPAPRYYMRVFGFRG